MSRKVWLFRSCLFIALAGSAFTLAVPASAADFPPITAEERGLTSVPWQPDAPAVVLFKKAELRLMKYPQEVSSSLEVHMRLKILSEEGKRYGEVAVAHTGFVRLKEFAGRTTLPDGREVPLTEEAIFREERSRTRKRYVTKAAFPALEVGSIIDYRYKMRWDSFSYLEPWYFQDMIPTVLSEITYIKPKNMALDPRSWTTGGGEMQMETRNTPKGVELRVWMENLGAIPDEPHSFPFEDLSSRFMMVPKEVAVSGTRLAVFDSWKSTCEWYDEGDDGYRRFRKEGRKAKKKAIELAAKGEDLRQRIGAIHTFVRDEIATRPASGIWVGGEGRGADDVLVAGKGYGIDKALLLQTMLEGIKIKSLLVWAADRRNGRIDTSVANPWWFERALVQVEIDGAPVYLDPSDRRLGFGHLSPYYEGTPAVLHAKKPEVITLPVTPHEQSTRTAEIDLKLDEEGRLTGAGSMRLTGHHAWRYLRWKDDAEATREAWQASLSDDFKGYDVGGIEVVEAVDARRIEVTWTLEQRPENVLGDEASLVPSLPLGPVDQLFTLPSNHRLTPVQMAFGDRDEVQLTVSWPDTWEDDILPLPADYQGPAGSLSVNVDLDQASRQLTYTRRLDIVQAEFTGRQHYVAIRELYGEAEGHDAQSLVLVRR
ncbi:MAG: DUF3857 domain-containing protein [Acidobacteriota bacterium]